MGVRKVNLSFDNKTILLIMCFIITILIIDTSIGKIIDFISYNPSIDWKIPLFTLACCVFVGGQYIVLKYVEQKIHEIRFKHEELRLRLVHKIVRIIQYILVVIVIVILLQVILLSYYNIIFLVTAIIITYALAIILMQLLARRFFSWYKSNKNIVILLYGISSALIAVNALLTLTFVSITLLTDKPTYILPHVGGMIPHIASGSLIDAINNTYIMTSIVAFIVTWTATAMLLRHHSHKTGAIKYWIIVSIPLGYFLSQFIDLFQAVFAPLPLDPISSLIIFTLGFTLSKPIGGILFAVAFWVIAKSIAHDNIVRSYMIISAFGFALLFVSNQAIVLVTAPYPPFGLATVSFVGLASYLVLIGIYSSASSVAQDVELRNSIRKFAISKSRFLDTIGTAHMEQEIEKNVVAIAKSHQDMMEEETGLRSSLSEDDIKEYLEMVLKEVKNSNKKDDK